jgi:predicted dehydrogenase
VTGTRIGVALYGGNGHQVQHLLVDHPKARLVAVAELDRVQLPQPLRDQADVTYYGTLEEILADPRVALVSLCSPRRRDQAAHACAALLAGKHVYAEKPCAMTEEDLDQILATARQTGRSFHEMAGMAFEQPYLAMRDVVQSGVLGEIVQVFAQKSYPYHDRRPQDEDVDAGLTAQAGVHALRMVEHVAGQHIAEIQAWETSLANPVPGGGLRMASSLMMRLENGGLASAVVNYLNPKGMGRWGNDHLRIFGTQGFVESTDGGDRTRLVVGDKDLGPLDTTAPTPDYVDRYLDALSGGAPMPLAPEEEVHPTRMTIHARQSAHGL